MSLVLVRFAGAIVTAWASFHSTTLSKFRQRCEVLKFGQGLRFSATQSNVIRPTSALHIRVCRNRSMQWSTAELYQGMGRAMRI